MKFFTIALVVVAFQLAPTVVQACDCGCTCEPLFRFKDGLTPNGPSNTEAIYGDPSRYPCGTYAFRDYSGTRVVTPPPPVDTKEMKRPSS